jgi:NTE family protein
MPHSRRCGSAALTHTPRGMFQGVQRPPSIPRPPDLTPQNPGNTIGIVAPPGREVRGELGAPPPHWCVRTLFTSTEGGTVALSVATTAFVFAGGGSLGAIEVGMLKALVARGVRADFVVGASVGAVNAAYFAGDPSAAGVARLERIWRGLHRADVFPLPTLRTLLGVVSGRGHLVDASALRGLLEEHLPYRRIEDGRLPCHILATDVLDGSPVAVSSGPVVEALLASAAIPGVFPPVRVGDRYLVDGSLASATPVSIAADLGAQRVVVLTTGFTCSASRPPQRATEAALHALNLLAARFLAAEATRVSARVAVAIVPPLCPLETSAYDFSRSGALIDRAEHVTLEWLDAGGLDAGTVPVSLRPHAHAADGSMRRRP